ERRRPPLLDGNEPTFRTHSYESSFSGEEAVLRDHKLNGDKLFPAAATLELALAGAARAMESEHIRLSKVVWMRPLKAGPEGLSLKLRLLPGADLRVKFEIATGD